MKTKRLLTLLLVVATAFCAAFAVGCKNKDEKPATVESVTLSAQSIELNTGDTLNYDAYTVTAGYSDGTSTTVPLTAAMFTAEDLAKFNTPGTYTVTVNAFGMQAMLTVTVKNRNFADVTAEDVTATYDGTAKVPVVANLPQGASVVWTYHVGTSAEGEVVTEPVNAGTYYAEGVVSLRYYDDKTLTANITISPKTINPAELTWANVKRVYTGQEIAVNVYPENLPDGVTVDGYEGDVKGTALGTYTVTVKFRNENPNYTIVETYNVEWSIINPLEATWYAAVNGELHVASFANTSATTGALDFDGAKTTYTVAYNETTGGATFSELNGSATDIALNGSILRITVGNMTYVLVNKEDLATYYSGNEYDMLTAQFKIDLDESAKTLRLVITTAAGTQEKPLTITAEENATLVREVKLVVDEDMWLEYNSTLKTVTIYGFENPNGYDPTVYYNLATATDVKELLAGLTNGTFVDVNGNELRVNGVDDVKYNGRGIILYTLKSGNSVCIYAAIKSDKVDAELVIGNGYYKFDRSVYYDKAGIAFAGTYYLDNDGTLSDTEKVEFMSYADIGMFDIRTKLLNAENTAESKTFTVNAAETSDRAVLNLAAGELTATLYLKNSTEVYATLVFKDNGATVVCGSKNFLKVDKLIEKAGWSSGEYYSADGTKLKYDGKGKFTLGDTDYTKYSLVFADGTLTVTIGEGDDTHVIVYTEKRYVTVDGEIYLNDQSSSLGNGYKDTATYINGDDTISVSKNVVKVNDVALTDVEFSFVDDGNNNGRTVLKISGKLGDKDYSVMFYSLLAVKTEDKAFVIKGDLSNLFLGEYVKDDNSFSFTSEGKVIINGCEVFPTKIIRNYGFNFEFADGNTLFACNIYSNGGQPNGTVCGKTITYVPVYYEKYKGLYVSEDKTSVFAFIKMDFLYANNNLYKKYDLKSNTAAETVLAVDGKIATFTVENGQNKLVYDGKTYVYDKNFALENYYGEYAAFNGNTYSNVKVDDKMFSTDQHDVDLTRIIMMNGDYVLVLKVGINDIYLLKNTDGTTSADLPYYAINKYYVDLIGNTKLNGKVLSVGFTIDNKGGKKSPVMNITYDGAAVRVVDYGTHSITVIIDGKRYIITATENEETEYAAIKVFDETFDTLFNVSYFNGNKAQIKATVDANGESIVVLLFNDEQVNATFSDFTNKSTGEIIGKLITFTHGGVNYKGNAAYATTPNLMMLTEDEYNFFFGSEFIEADAVYRTEIDGKEFLFDYNTNKTLFTASDMRGFVFDKTVTSYNGKKVTFITYSYEAKVVVFSTEDGSYAYNVETSVLTTVTLPPETVLIGTSIIGAKNTPVASIYVTARIVSVKGSNIEVSFWYDFRTNSDGTPNLATATKVDGGYKLTGLVGKNNPETVVSYLVEEKYGYALYSADQYEIIGEYEVGGKTLVINGTHENGVFSYTATYGDETNVKVEPDFTKKSFTFVGKTVVTIFSWTVDNGEMVITGRELPVSATAFIVTGSDNMINIDRDYNNYSVTITIKDVVDNKVKYNIAYTSGYGDKVAEGVLSDDGTYISAAIIEGTSKTDVKVRIYLNAVTDANYKLVAVYESSDSAKYVGEFGLGGTDKLTVTLAATSREEYDDDDESVIKFGSANFRITYTVGGNSVTATVKYARTLANGLEFKANGKTYVAKLVDGAMTVTEKTAA